jgi:hypothetical protein
VKENSDVESSENSSENGESGEESGEEIEVEGIEIEGQAEEIEGEEGEEIEGEEGEEIEGEEGEEIEGEEGEEIEGEESEVESEGQAEEIEPDIINSAGPVDPDGSGPDVPGLDVLGPVGPVGSGPIDPVSPAGPPGAAVPAISLLPPTPVKNKGKGKATSDDNQDMLQNKPDFNPDSLMVDSNELGRFKRGRERSGTGEVRGSKTQRRSLSHSTAPTVPSTEDDDPDDLDDMEDIDDIDAQGSSRSTGGFSRGRAMGNHFNWGDEDAANWGDEDANANPADWNAPTRGKVLLFVNRDPGAPPYMTFTTNTTSELPVVLEELSGRFSPIEKRDCRIYVYEDEAWEVKGRFSQALKDDSPLPWTEKDDSQLVLYLLAVGILFFDIVHICNSNNFQDDLVDEFMNPKPASGSGPAASSSAETGSKSEIRFKPKPMQKMLIEIFNPSAHLILHERVTTLRLTYAKYLAIQKMIQDVSNKERAGTWNHPKPTVQDIAEVFMSRSGYFNRPRLLFPKVELALPEMKKWLEGKKDAPEQNVVWGDKEPSFKNLKEILDSHTSGKKKKVTRAKQQPSKSEVVVKEKAKKKDRAKKAGESSKGKKAGPKKSRQNAD